MKGKKDIKYNITIILIPFLILLGLITLYHINEYYWLFKIYINQNYIIFKFCIIVAILLTAIFSIFYIPIKFFRFYKNYKAQDQGLKTIDFLKIYKIPPSFFEISKKTFYVVQNKLGYIILIYLIFCLPFYIMFYFFSHYYNVFLIFINLIELYPLTAVIYLTTKTIENKNIDFYRLIYVAFNKVPKVFFASLSALFFVVLFSFFFLIPGLIKAAQYFFINQLLILTDVKIFKALTISKKIAKKKIPTIIVVMIFMLIVNIAVSLVWDQDRFMIILKLFTAGIINLLVLGVFTTVYFKFSTILDYNKINNCLNYHDIDNES